MKNVELLVYNLGMSPKILNNIINNEGFCANVSCNDCVFDNNNASCLEEFAFNNRGMLQITEEIHRNIDIPALKSNYPEYFI